MIVVKLQGGLGNQMFQYAAGRRLAHLHRTELKLDLSWFDRISPVITSRKYELSAYPIRATVATVEDMRNFMPTKLPAMLNRLIAQFLPLRMHRYVLERQYHFDPDILSLPDDVYLDGYWQCPNYFVDIASTIRDEFTLRNDPDPENHQLVEEIKGTESVAVHIRRGDYISHPAHRRLYATCSREYYQSAAEMIAGRVRQPYYFVFSDDPDWVRKNVTSVSPVRFIDHNGPDRACEDMRLMSCCKHHIIANSSFSWWGAWLSRSADKIVIAPTHWFKDETLSTRDLIPRQWMQL
jgi:hypothetical protein